MKIGAWGIAFLSIAAGFACRPAFCWDKVGHMVVDQVAYGHLTPAAKTQVDSLIATLNTDPLVTGLDDRYRPYNPITEGALMDDIRGETKDFNTWHYVDLPDTELTPAQITAQFGDAANPNAYEIIVDKCEKTLADPTRPAADRARMLAFLCHLVGDIHQPLHAIGRDLGGNRYRIDPLPSIDPNSEWHINNLHSFWDNAYRYDDVNGKITVVYDQADLPRTMSPTMPVLTAYAHGLEARYPASDAAEKDLVPADWAAESQHLALTTAFPPATVSSLSPDYVHTAHDVACARLVLAGNRLANVLNQLFK